MQKLPTSFLTTVFQMPLASTTDASTHPLATAGRLIHGSAASSHSPSSPNSESDDAHLEGGAPQGGVTQGGAPQFTDGPSSTSSSASSSCSSSTHVTFEIRCSVRTFAMRASDLNQLDTLKDRVAFAIVRLEKVPAHATGGSSSALEGGGAEEGSGASPASASRIVMLARAAAHARNLEGSMQTLQQRAVSEGETHELFTCSQVGLDLSDNY